MKNLLLIAGLLILISSCKKSKDDVPTPDFGQWANIGNNIFNTPMPGDPDTLVHAPSFNKKW